MIFKSCILLACLYLTTGYRLPRNVMPEHYSLEIMTYLGEKDNFNFDGKVYIETSCAYPTKNITLHSENLDIKTNDIRVKDISSKTAKELKNLKVEFDKENDFLIILLEEPLKEVHKYEIYIPFRGKLDDGLAGFYRSSYVDQKTKEKRWLGVTQFEAISARRAFPCFDEPEMKATFDITIGRKKGYHAISNMPLYTTEPIKEKEGWYWDVFDTSVPMSTYLVAFVVSDFGYKQAEQSDNNNVTFRTWARKDALDQVDFAKEVGPKALEYYEKFFNIKYPLPKLDMIALPDFSAGAMENWGLITYREQYLLYDDKLSSKTSQHSVASVIAHELAHQWFGNLVTMKWWTDLWLNEGFATYMASLAVENLFPEWNSLQEEAVENLLSVFSFDSLKTSHPVSVPIGNPNEIDEIFDTISYKKGSSLIRMMSLFLGEETLRKGVSNYLKKHKYGNAEQDDLWESLTAAAHENGVLPKNLTVKTIMDTWTLQTGYPIINVERNYKDKTVTVNQRRFFKDINALKDADKSCWWVPLSYSTKSHLNFESTTPKNWLSCPSHPEVIENIAKEDDWIIFNNKMAGIYKVNYDSKNWQLITQTLLSDNYRDIPLLNRVQLITDSADLAYVNQLKYDIFFDLVKYLEREHEYLAWKAALSKTQALNTQLKKSPVFGYFKEYMQKLLTPIYDHLGGLVIPKERSEKLESIKLQVLTASQSCKFDVENCVQHAQDLFKQLQNSSGEQNPIPKDLKGVVYCTSVRYGGESEWNFLWHLYQHSNVATEKNTILNALGCSREIWILNRYLEWSLDDSKIRRQDCPSVFNSVANQDVGYYVAKKFFFENAKRIFKHLLPETKRLSRYLSALTRQMNDVKEQEELENFIENNTDIFSTVKQGVEQSLETVRVNIQWQRLHADEFMKILSRNSERT